MHAIVQADAPGSLMLFGEHAVLHGHPALVCAVDRRIRIRLSPRSDRSLVLRSSLGAWETSVDAPASDDRFRFVLAARAALGPRIPGGCTLEIESDFPGLIGLGTSAAVTVATLAALSAWVGADTAPQHLLDQARAAIRRVQGLGSGADAAASVMGGIVAFRAAPDAGAAGDGATAACRAEPLGCIHPITVAYAGYKMPTPEVVRLVEAAGRRQPRIQAALLALIGQTAAEAEARIRTGCVEQVGELMTAAHGLMEALGVGDARLAELVYRLRGMPGITGSKISGSGLGDCVVGWGRPDPFPQGRGWVPVTMTEQGVRIH